MRVIYPCLCVLACSWICLSVCTMDFITTDTKTKCCLLKKFTCKGTLRQVFFRVIDWRYMQSCWYFRPSFVNYCPSNLLYGSPTPPPSLRQIPYIQTVSGWEGKGMLSPVGDHILQEFNTLYLTRFRTTKLLDHPKQNPRRRGGLRQINTMPPSPFTGQFLRKADI